MSKIIIVGAGIVGLCSAWSAQRRGHHVTLIDTHFEGDRASHGNAGCFAVSECVPFCLAGLGLTPLKWLIDPLGPLAINPWHAPKLLPWFLALRRVSDPNRYQAIAQALFAINHRALADMEVLLADIGLKSALHKVGALTVYESEKAFLADRFQWQLKRELGVKWRQIDRREINRLEPNLAPVFNVGVVNEDCAHIDDPKQLVQAIRKRVVDLGATLIQGHATSIQMHRDAATQEEKPMVRLTAAAPVVGDQVVIAAGAWSAILAKSLGDRVLLESERGYNTTLTCSKALLNREVMFAEKNFVATPLAVGLRIGGAAEFTGLNAPANYRRSDALFTLAKKFIQNLDERHAEKWMGQRPATPDSLPVIGTSPRHPKVYYAFGHGHLGLTQGATTGELIADLLDGTPSSIPLAPYSIARF